MTKKQEFKANVIMSIIVVVGLIGVFLSYRYEPETLRKVTGDALPTNIERVGLTLDYLRDNPVDVDVAIIDTGISKHPDLNVVGGFDCTGKGDWTDKLGHGTHVAGIVGAKMNGTGIVGMAPGARLWAIKVFDDRGYATYESIMCGLHWVAIHSDTVRVVNMSLGGPVTPDDAEVTCNEFYARPDPTVVAELEKTVAAAMTEVVIAPTVIPYGDGITSTPYPTHEPYQPYPGEYYQPEPPPADDMHDAICKMHELGIIIVAAAGNSGVVITDRDEPAGYPEVISVGNMADFDGKGGGQSANTEHSCNKLNVPDDSLYFDKDATGWQASFFYGTTSYGPLVDIAAPGTCIYSTWLDGGYHWTAGTSMASPHVAGAIARYLSEYPDATVDAVMGWLALYGSVPANSPNGFTGSIDGHPERMLYLSGRYGAGTTQVNC